MPAIHDRLKFWEIDFVNLTWTVSRLLQVVYTYGELDERIGSLRLRVPKYVPVGFGSVFSSLAA